MFITLLALFTNTQSQCVNEIVRYSKFENCTYSFIDNKNDIEKIKNFLKTINEGNKLIFESCESVDEHLGFLESSKKPSCRYNNSYINNSDIHVYPISENVREFIQTQKRIFCKSKKIECGELTVILKLIDLINSGIKISLNLNNTDNLWINLEIIDFFQMTEVYFNALNNIEILTNITLSHLKANIILNLEKEKLNLDLRKNNKIFNKLILDIKNVFSFVGDSLGSLFGGFLGGTLSGIGLEISPIFKIIIGLLLLSIVYSKIKIQAS